MSDWQRVQILFLESIDLPPDERSKFLEFSCAGDTAMMSEIESLLAADTDSEALIEAAVQDIAASYFDTHALIGQRLGLYRVVREIGRGGMGSVYLAVRDDQEYQKEVAIKVVRRGMDTADVLERFRYERQILANLEHPYIARLFDGGSTADGVPFFVMEYIQGRPVDVFCREQSLDSKAICELFVLILEGIAYAHRNLVVHRDLKPANILITADGMPKLLDFGVAKLLSGDAVGNHTMTAVTRPYTPEYASPEQVMGLPITTSTDIYCLGAVLYELLTGKRAHPIESHTPAHIERIICQTEVVRPRSQVPALASDLDNIVMMSLRRDPERRYQSAGQFAEDLRRYLDGRPVVAQKDSVAYRAAKFVSRNWLEVAGAAVVAASLIVGLAVSIAQTHRADVELQIAESQRRIAQHQTDLAEAASLNASSQKARAEEQRKFADLQRDRAEDQKGIADHQKAIAEERIKEILQLADRTLFDVHDAIAKLPGSVAARQSLVKTTLEYLEGLQRETGLDDQMRAMLCAAYFKIAMIQGDMQGASLQDSDASEKSLLKGQALLMPAYRRHPNDPEMILRLIEIRATLADLTFRAGRQMEAIQAYTDLLPPAHKLFLLKTCDVECRSQEPTIEGRITYELIHIEPRLALEHANRSIELDRQLLSQYPNDALLEQAMASTMAASAGAYRGLGDLERSASLYREAIEVREQLMHDDPNDTMLRRNLLVNYGNYVMLLGVTCAPNLNRPDEARTYAAKGIQLARNLVSLDAEDATARHDLGMILSRFGMIYPGPDGIEESLQSLEEAEGLIAPIAVSNPKSAETAVQLSSILQYEGNRQEALGRNREALASYRKAIATLQPFFDAQVTSSVVQYILDEQDLAAFYASSGDFAHATDLSNRAFAQMKKYTDRMPPSDEHNVLLAESWSFAAKVQAMTGMADSARQSAATALALWNETKNLGLLSQYRKNIAEMQALAASPAKNH